MKFRKVGILSAAYASMCLNAAYADIVDQSQDLTTSDGRGPLAIGGEVKQRLSQTFSSNRNGQLVAVGFPIGCSSGSLIVEVRDVEDGKPGDRIVQRTTKPASDFAETPGLFVQVTLDSPVPINAVNSEYAIVLSNETGECGVLRAPLGNPYRGGDLFFESGPEFAGWQRNDLDGAHADSSSRDLPFRTYLADGAIARTGERCDVRTADGVLSIDPNTIACRCFTDRDLLQRRCGVLHPDFFFERIAPWPLEPGKPFDETLRFTPRTRLDADVRVTLEGAGRSEPEVCDFSVRLKPGRTKTLVVRSIAPKEIGQQSGVARFEYPMSTSSGKILQKFDLDISSDESSVQ